MPRSYHSAVTIEPGPPRQRGGHGWVSGSLRHSLMGSQSQRQTWSGAGYVWQVQWGRALGCWHHEVQRAPWKVPDTCGKGGAPGSFLQLP